MYQQACYIVQPRSAYRVSLSGFGHVSRAFLLPFECTTISVRPPFGGVANALGNSDIAHSCSWNSAVFILYCPIVFRLQSIALLSRVAFRDRCMRLEPPLFPTLKISYDRQQSRVMLGLPVVCRVCYSCKTVCQGVIRYFASLVRFFW